MDANVRCGECRPARAQDYPGKKDNATPLFDWGKYYEKDGKVVIPISVQAHHSFVDGLHVAQFAQRLQTFFDEF